MALKRGGLRTVERPDVEPGELGIEITQRNFRGQQDQISVGHYTAPGTAEIGVQVEGVSKTVHLKQSTQDPLSRYLGVRWIDAREVQRVEGECREDTDGIPSRVQQDGALGLGDRPGTITMAKPPGKLNVAERPVQRARRRQTASKLDGGSERPNRLHGQIGTIE